MWCHKQLSGIEIFCFPRIFLFLCNFKKYVEFTIQWRINCKMTCEKCKTFLQNKVKPYTMALPSVFFIEPLVASTGQCLTQSSETSDQLLASF